MDTTPTTEPEPELVQVDAVDTAVVRGVVAMAELPAFFDGAFATLGAALARQEATPTGAAFALYRGAPGETADLEVGFPVAAAVDADGDVEPGALPGGRVARVVHHGSFDGLGESWTRLAHWMQDRGLTPGPVFWEVYLTEPTPEMDPADLRTELSWPTA